MSLWQFRTWLGCSDSTKCAGEQAREPCAAYRSDEIRLRAVGRARSLGVGTAETVRKRGQAQVDAGARPGVSTEESAELKRSMPARVEPMSAGFRVPGEVCRQRRTVVGSLGDGRPISGSAISRDFTFFDTERLGRTAVANERRFTPGRTRNYGSQALDTLGRQQWLDRPSTGWNTS